MNWHAVLYFYAAGTMLNFIRIVSANKESPAEDRLTSLEQIQLLGLVAAIPVIALLFYSFGLMLGMLRVEHG